jgi:hypothetical protein
MMKKIVILIGILFLASAVQAQTSAEIDAQLREVIIKYNGSEFFEEDIQKYYIQNGPSGKLIDESFAFDVDQAGENILTVELLGDILSYKLTVERDPIVGGQGVIFTLYQTIEQGEHVLCTAPFRTTLPNDNVTITHFQTSCGFTFQAEYESISLSGDFDTDVEIHGITIANATYSKYLARYMSIIQEGGTKRVLDNLREANRKFRVKDLKNPFDFSVATDDNPSQLHPGPDYFSEESGDKDKYMVIADDSKPIYLIILKESGAPVFGEDETFIVYKALGENTKLVSSYANFDALLNDEKLLWTTLGAEPLPTWEQVSDAVAEAGTETSSLLLGAELAVLSKQYSDSFVLARNAKAATTVSQWGNDILNLQNVAKLQAHEINPLVDSYNAINRAIAKGQDVTTLLADARAKLNGIKAVKTGSQAIVAANKAILSLDQIPKFVQMNRALRTAAKTGSAVSKVGSVLKAPALKLGTATATGTLALTPVGWVILGATTAADVGFTVYDHTATKTESFDGGNLVFNWDEEATGSAEAQINFIFVGKETDETIKELAVTPQFEGEGVLRYRLTQKSMDTIIENVSIFFGKTPDQIHEAIDTTLTKKAEEDGESVTYRGKFLPNEEGSESIEEGYWATLPDGVFEGEFEPMTQGKYILTLSIDGFEDIEITIIVDATNLSSKDAEEITDEDIFPIQIGNPKFEIDECDACATILACLACTDSKIASKYD